MSLTIIEPPELEPVSLIAAKAYLRLDNDREDGLIESFIRTARKSLEAFTGRCLIKQMWRFTVNAGFAAAVSDFEYLAGHHSRGGKGGIEIPKSPYIGLVGSPFLNDEYGRREIKDFRIDSSQRLAHIHFGPELSQHLNGKATLEILFYAGYGSDPSEVPDAFKQAILMVVAQLYEVRGPINDNFTNIHLISSSALQLVKPYRVMRFI